MRIGIAADHGGFPLKEQLLVRLKSAGHEVVDFGAHQLTPDDDYPDFVIPLGQAVAADTVDRGVAVCGSGVGASVCANKIKGVRACLIEDHFSAKQGVEDDNLSSVWADASKARNWRGIWFRRFSPRNSLKPTDTCDGCARWQRWRHKTTTQK